jgi:hypothetical protein
LSFAGVDVTANQDEISDHETFQLEFDWSTKRWYIRTMQDRYWTLETGGGIQAAGDKRSSNALFDLMWQGDGSVAFRANNGRYVITKRSGHLYATSDTIDDNCKYFFYLVNRPILVLKSEQGFVGYKSASSPKLECNKATYETIQVERGEKGIVYFKGESRCSDFQNMSKKSNFFSLVTEKIFKPRGRRPRGIIFSSDL